MRDLLSQERLQDRQIPRVLQGEHDDLPGVVEPWRSGRVELGTIRQDEGANGITWKDER